MLTNFTVPVSAPDLVGGIGQGGDTDKFVALFGAKWKKTPKKGVWFIGTDGMQFTCVKLSGGRLDIAFYDYATVAEFRQEFDLGYHVANAVYFQTNDTGVIYKYPSIRIIKFLSDQGLWV